MIAGGTDPESGNQSCCQRFQPAVHRFSLDATEFNLERLFRRMSRLPHCLFLDGQGAAATNELNRFSFLCADPIDRLEIKPGQSFEIDAIRTLSKEYCSQLIADLPPFQGGVAGLLSYDAGRQLQSGEKPTQRDAATVPLIALFVYDVVFAFDHYQQYGWVISQGWPEESAVGRGARAGERMRYFQKLLEGSDRSEQNFADKTNSEFQNQPQTAIDSVVLPNSRFKHRLGHELELFSDFSRDRYLGTVGRAIDYIYRGDVFQVNLSQQLATTACCSTPELYLNLRAANPAPFSAYLDFGAGQIASASPERLVACQNRSVETRPIKGTRPRTGHPEIDLAVERELQASEKDRAENTMIVDLMRNDLSRVCEPDSVLVSKLCGVERFESVLHLVSVVVGRLDQHSDCFDLLDAVFPGGSITGAPKLRAMEIIDGLESGPRGPYCGSIGYINTAGDLDFNILIRTITAIDGRWIVPVGGGIVSDSSAVLEYAETTTKAAGMLRAIQRCHRDRSGSVAEAASQIQP